MMGIFDLGNKTKAYKRGLSDDAAINAKKEKQLKRASDAVIKWQDDNNQKIFSGLDDIQDILETTEKEKIYGENYSIQLLNLSEQERTYIVETIYTIALEQDSISQNQQNYFGALKSYLAVTDDDKIDLGSIRKIEDIDVSMAVLKVVYEFKYLENRSWDFESSQIYRTYLEGFRLNQKDMKDIKTRIVENLKFGDDILISQYKVQAADQGSSYVNKETSDDVEVDSDEEQDPNEHQDSEQTSFERVIQSYTYPESDFKHIDNGVALVQRTRALLLDAISDALDQVTPFTQRDVDQEALGEYRNNYRDYILATENLAQDKRNAKLAAGKKSLAELSLKSGMLLALPLIVSPVVLKSMKGNKIARQEYGKDLIRLQRATLSNIEELHEGMKKIGEGKEDANHQFLGSLKSALDILDISYDKLPSVDFRQTSFSEKKARKLTRNYIKKHLFEVKKEKSPYSIRLYNDELEKKQEGYLTKKEIEGAFGKILAYQGSPNEIVGMIDMTLGNSGKCGILFLDDQLVVKEILSHPVRIRYQDVDDVIGNLIVAHSDTDGVYQYLVTEVDVTSFKVFLENILTFWRN